jgi:hypothetical protein
MRIGNVHFPGVHAITCCQSMFTPIPEIAVVRHIDGIGHASRNAVKAIHRAVNDRFGSHQSHGVRVQRIVKYFQSRSLFHDPPCVHDDDIIRHLCDHTQVVSNEHDA